MLRGLKIGPVSDTYLSYYKRLWSEQPYLKWFVLISIWLIVLLFVPAIATIVLIINFFAMALVSGLQIYSASLPDKNITTVSRNDKPFVSIHIPTYNEPPELVCDTLNALIDLDYENYEVIVLDNNTKKVETWYPVKQHCKKLGKRFHFEHVENLKGYKAGALNICLELSSDKTEYILVIDADYKVQPEILTTSLSYFTDDRIALVQFPQSYSNAHEKNRGMSDEYEHFFQVYMNMANCLNCVLSTGTVSVIRKKALSEVGNWSDRTITEDVDLGLRLHEAGFHGVYVPIPLGKGLMPTDLKSLRQQRERWVYGNTQTLFNFIKMSKKNITAWQSLGIFTQLTAWVNFMLIPAITLILAGFSILVNDHPSHSFIVEFSLFTIWAYLIFKMTFFSFAFLRRGKSAQQAFYAYLVHLGMIWEGGSSWLRFMIRDNPGFKRTNKFKIVGPTRDLIPGFAFSIIMILCGILLLLNNAVWPAIFSILLAPFFLSVIYIYRQIQNTYEFNYGNHEIKS
ncbi:MAG: glycosyltransferase family 2 protein [Balneolales bacterium]